MRAVDRHWPFVPPIVMVIAVFAAVTTADRPEQPADVTLTAGPDAGIEDELTSYENKIVDKEMQHVMNSLNTDSSIDSALEFDLQSDSHGLQAAGTPGERENIANKIAGGVHVGLANATALAKGIIQEAHHEAATFKNEAEKMIRQAKHQADQVVNAAQASEMMSHVKPHLRNAVMARESNSGSDNVNNASSLHHKFNDTNDDYQQQRQKLINWNEEHAEHFSSQDVQALEANAPLM